MSIHKQRFTDIYNTRSWVVGDEPEESRSGPGSTVNYTENLQRELPKIFSQFSIKTFLDAPCGDLMWMQNVLQANPELNYIGGDIVEALVTRHTNTYKDVANVNFVNLDIINDPLPDADMMMCRDCLFHLSETDIKTFLSNFVSSNISYLLTTSHTINFTEQDIVTGSYRSLNLLLPPYNFTSDYLYSLADWIPPHPERKMYVWSKQQIQKIVDEYNKPPMPVKIYDCFTFYNELDLLELRLAELYDSVDTFVIVESDHTFQNMPKAYILDDNLERFSKYLDKIVCIKYKSHCHSNPWDNEQDQRNAILDGIIDAEDTDIILISDVDEFIRPEVIANMRINPRQIYGFRVPYFNFRLNYMLTDSAETYSIWSLACQRRWLTMPNVFRSERFSLNNFATNYDDGAIKVYEHAGWHFTYLGDTEFIRNKLRSFSHSELNTADILAQIDVDDSIRRGVGFNPLDPRPFAAVAVDDYFPKTILNNMDKYADRIISGVEISALRYLPK